MGKVVVAGGSGFVGSAVVSEASAMGDEVVVLSRSSRPVRSARSVGWDGRTVGDWAAELEGAAAVVNLSGHPVVDRWTPRVKELIRSSRVDSTRAVGEAIQSCAKPPPCWVNASAIGYYGDTGSREVSEAAAPAQDFLGRVCQEWEGATLDARTPETRKVCLRIGIVLGRDAGAMKLLTLATKAFLGGALGSGRQWMSWIHARDLARMVLWATRTDVRGPMNATAPHPVTNAQFMAELRAAFGRPPVPNAPTPLVRLLARVQGIPAEMLLGGSRVVPAIPLAHGFEFAFPRLREALADLLDDVPAAWREPIPETWAEETP